MINDWEDKKKRMALLGEEAVAINSKQVVQAWLNEAERNEIAGIVYLTPEIRQSIRSLLASVAGAEEAPASLNVYPRKGWEAPGIPEHDELIEDFYYECKCKGDFTCEGHRG